MVFDPANQDERLPAPHSEGLFRFMREPLGLRKLEGAALARFWRLVYQPEAELVRDENVVPFQIAVGYRLVRAIALFRGLINEDETLVDGLADRPEAWFKPTETAPGKQSNAQDVLDMVNEQRGMGPIPLMPPAPTQRTFKQWYETVARISRLLGMGKHRAGRLGLAAILDPKRVLRVFPNRQQILAFEELLLAEAIELIVAHGNDAAVRCLVENYGFDPREARGVVRTARAKAATDHASSLEEERAILLAQLSDLGRRARQAMDLKTERSALRDRAAILGLTRAEPEDTLSDLLNVVKRVAQGTPGPKLLPRTIDVTQEARFSDGPEPAETLFKAPKPKK